MIEQDDDIKKETLEQLMQVMDGMSAGRLPKRDGVVIEISPGGSVAAAEGAEHEEMEDPAEFDGIDPRFADILRRKKQEMKA